MRQIQSIMKQSPLMSSSCWSQNWAVTLTLKQVLATEQNLRRYRKSIDEFLAKDCFRYFMHRLNERVYKHGYKQFGKRLRVIPILEKGERWHFQISIEPAPQCYMSHDSFEQAIRECWERCHWAHKRIEIKREADDGWTDYNLKAYQKSAFEAWSDSIDFENLHNPLVILRWSKKHRELMSRYRLGA